MAINAASKPKGRIGRPFTILGALLAVIALGAFYLVSTGLQGGKASSSAPATLVEVVVAAKDLPIRTPIQDTDVVLKRFASTDAPPGALTKIAQVKDQNLVAAVDLSKGEALAVNLLAKSSDVITGAQTGYLPIPPGFVALTIPTSETTGVAGYIQANDYVQVLVVTTGQGGKSKVQTVYNNLHVIHVGPATLEVTAVNGKGPTPVAAAPAAKGAAASLTVVATQCQAEFLYWFQANAQIKYTLGSYKEYKPADTQPDAACPKVDSAKGVTKDEVNGKWPGLIG